MSWLVRGREARPAAAAWNLGKTLLQTTIFWLVFVAAVPLMLFFAERRLGLQRFQVVSPTLRLAALGLFVLAAPLNLWSGIIMAVAGRGTPLPLDCPRALVVRGPYRFVRNPMAVGGLAICGAAGLYLGSPSSLLLPIVGGLLWNYVVRPWEEADLLARFGEPYAHYRDHVRCWWPRFTSYDPRE